MKKMITYILLLVTILLIGMYILPFIKVRLKKNNIIEGAVGTTAETDLGALADALSAEASATALKNDLSASSGASMHESFGGDVHGPFGRGSGATAATRTLMASDKLFCIFRTM